MQEDIIQTLQIQHLVKLKILTFCCEKEKESLHHNCLSKFLAGFNPRCPNVSKIINKHRHLLKTDDTLKELFPRNSIVVANKEGRNLQELLARADPYNIKSDLLDLKDRDYKKCGKSCNSYNNFVDEISFVISKATGQKYRRDSTCTQKMIYIWLTSQNVGEQGTSSAVS